MINKINDIKSEVYLILKGHPETRDNDSLLMVKLWCRQNSYLRPDPRTNRRSIDFETFAKDFIRGRYASPESIRRTRQKIQEKYPNLRGLTYGERKKKAVEMQKEIKFV